MMPVYEYAIITLAALRARDFAGLRWHYSVAEALAKTPTTADPYSGRVPADDPVLIRHRHHDAPDVLEAMDMAKYVWKVV